MVGRPLEWGPGRACVADYLLRPGGPAITAEAKLVYLALFSYMDNLFTCRPKVETIAEGTGLSERTVQRRLDELEAAGLMTSDRFKLAKQGKGRKAATYTLGPPWATESAPTGDSVTPVTTLEHIDQTYQQTGDSVTPVTPTYQQTGDSVTPVDPPTGDRVTPHRCQRDTCTGDCLTPQGAQCKKPNEGDSNASTILEERAPSIWAQVVEQLVSRPKAETWLQTLTLVQVDGTTWYVAPAGGSFARDRMASRYSGDVAAMLADLAPGVTVRYVTAAESHAMDAERRGRLITV